MKKGLGKGLGALFEEPALVVLDKKERETDGAFQAGINELEPLMGQPRKTFDQTALNELAESIKEHGILQPLAVRRTQNGRYEIVAGERRWRAAKIAGLKTVPVVVLELGDRQAREAALVENLQREDLNPIEEALGFQGLIEDYGLTQEEAAARVGKSRSVVANALRLLALPESVTESLKKGEISAGHARALLALKDHSKMEEMAQRIIKDGLSVRAVENEAKKPPDQGKKARGKKISFADIHIKALEEELSEAAGRRVLIRHGKKGGRIELEYYGSADLEALIEKLKTVLNS